MASVNTHCHIGVSIPHSLRTQTLVQVPQKMHIKLGNKPNGDWMHKTCLCLHYLLGPSNQMDL